jgi:excinuclease ABC subunit C
MNDRLAQKLKTLPTTPGVYLMKNDEGNIIYVGKAVNLRNRVRSYFRKQPKEAAKTIALVHHIVDLEYIIVDNETEALVLENNLIKKYRPKYNIALKDSKTYPYVRITKEAFPRIYITRHVVRDGSRYFGPYTNVNELRETLDLLHHIYPWRTCSNTELHKGQGCLNAHIGLCSAPCMEEINEVAYGAMMDEVAQFFAGHTEELVHRLEKEMNEAAEKLDFEKAAERRDQMRAIQKISDRQKAASDRTDNYDVVAMGRDDLGAIVEIFFIRSGKIIGRETYPLHASQEDTTGEIFSSFMTQFYLDQEAVPPLIYIYDHFADEETLAQLLSQKHDHKVQFHVPQRGKTSSLMELVERNVADALAKRIVSQKTALARTQGAMEDLQRYLGLKNLPRRIECYDISNIQGTDSVASMVVFVDGKPAKSQYRRFKIKTVEGPNDFASMNEVITRRFHHATEELETGTTAGKFTWLPDLVIIDGGKGQLKYARAAMRKEGYASIPTFGLAKQEELLFQEGRDDPIVLPRASNALYLVQRVRDESHRFAITYHRSLRGKRQLASVLDDIPGVGQKRKAQLLTHFGTFSKILSAEPEELAQVPEISSALAQTIYDYLQTHQDLLARIKQNKH